MAKSVFLFSRMLADDCRLKTVYGNLGVGHPLPISPRFPPSDTLINRHFMAILPDQRHKIEHFANPNVGLSGLAFV